MHNIKRHVPLLAYSALVPYITIGKILSGRLGSGELVMVVCQHTGISFVFTEHFTKISPGSGKVLASKSKINFPFFKQDFLEQVVL